MTKKDWNRLGAKVRERIEQLDLTQSEVQSRGGPSPAKVREVMNGRATTMSASKKRDLERALDWEEGSVDDVLDGRDPKPFSRLGRGLSSLIPEGGAPPSREEAEKVRVRRVIQQAWSKVTDFIEDFITANPSPSLRQKTRVLVDLIGLQLTDYIIGSELPAVSRDELLSGLYYERGRASYRLGEFHAMETAAKQNAPAEAVEDEEVDRSTEDPEVTPAGLDAAVAAVAAELEVEHRDQRGHQPG